MSRLTCLSNSGHLIFGLSKYIAHVETERCILATIGLNSMEDDRYEGLIRDSV